VVVGSTGSGSASLVHGTYNWSLRFKEVEVTLNVIAECCGSDEFNA